MRNIMVYMSLISMLISPTMHAAAQEYVVPGSTPDHIRRAVESPARNEADSVRDAVRLPAEILTLVELQEGDHIIEISALGQYYSTILSAAVGPQGKIDMYDLPAWEQFNAKINGEAFSETHSNAEYHMISYDDADYASGVDTVINVLSYHDLPSTGVNTARMNAMLFAALKPGGKYLIVDHQAEAGSAWRDADTLHRIDKALIISEVTAAGFELATDSSLLAHPEDDKTLGAFALRGQTDRAVLVFRKPLD